MINEQGKKIITKLTENIYFNEKYQEFQNIYISDKNREHIMIFDGNNWTLQNISFIDNLIENVCKFAWQKYDLINNDEYKKENSKIIDRVTKKMKYIELTQGFQRETDISDIKEDENEYFEKRVIEFKPMVVDDVKLLLYNKRNNLLKKYKNENSL